MHHVYMYVYVIKMHCSNSIGIAIGNTFFMRYWYWYRQYFLKQVLVLVLPILSKSIVNNPAGDIGVGYEKVGVRRKNFNIFK